MNKLISRENITNSLYMICYLYSFVFQNNQLKTERERVHICIDIHKHLYWILMPIYK